MMVSGEQEPKQMALYFYNRTRSYDTLNDLLKIDPDRYIHSDGYGAYHHEEYRKDMACLAHIRRKFHDAMITNPAHKEIKKLKDKEEVRAFLKAHPTYVDVVFIMDKIKELFRIDRKLKEKPIQDRWRIKREQSLPVFHVLYEKIGSIQSQYIPQSKMGKAITYAWNEKEYMKNYYLDGRLEISNNRAERYIQSMVMARKNFCSPIPKGEQKAVLCICHL